MLRILFVFITLSAVSLNAVANTYALAPGSKALQNMSVIVTDAIAAGTCEELTRTQLIHATSAPITAGSFKIKIKPAVKGTALPTSLNVKRVVYDNADPAVLVSATGFSFGPIPLKNGKGKTKYPMGVGPASNIAAGYREAIQLCPLGAAIPAGATISIKMRLKFAK